MFFVVYNKKLVFYDLNYISFDVSCILLINVRKKQNVIYVCMYALLENFVTSMLDTYHVK